MQNRENRDINRNVGERNVGERSAGQNIRQGWDQFRSRVRGKWNDISERDLDQYQGRRREDLVGYIGERTGGRREDIDRDVDTFARDTGYRFQ